MAGTELGEFLRTRRALLRPEDVGIESYGARRVPGLRREELAQLAGVSPTYYTRLEQSQSHNASTGVLDALAQALRLNEHESQHLHALAQPVRARQRAQSRPDTARPGAKALALAMADTPAVIINVRNDVLAWNPLAHRLVAGHLDLSSPDRPADRPNLARLLFVDAHTRDLYSDWNQETKRVVAYLRFAAGRNPDDRQLAELIGELSIKSPEFAGLWSRHLVQDCGFGVKHFCHPTVGKLDLSYEVMHLADGSGHRAAVYHAEPGSSDAAALELLAREISCGT